MASSSSSSRNWVYDVFVSFRGEDVRKTFLSHFQKELDRKLIKTFIDEKIDKGQSLDPVLKQAIKTSRIAVVVFSENYASSSWCLDELVEIMKCNEELDQVIIPIFYGVDPTHVRKQTEKFGVAFAHTCEEKSENETKLWRQSLTKVANLCGNHSQNWSNEANMVEEIVDDVLEKILNLIPNDKSLFRHIGERASDVKLLLADVIKLFITFRLVTLVDKALIQMKDCIIETLNGIKEMDKAFIQYSGRCIPSSFCTENLVKLKMEDNKLVRLWERVEALNALKESTGFINLKELPCSKATNLKKLSLRSCPSLFDLKHFNTPPRPRRYRRSSL